MAYGLYYLGAVETPRLAEEMQALNVSPAGIAHMLQKGRLFCFKVTGLSTPAALILKQDLLSKGGEAALERDSIFGHLTRQNSILIATPAQYRRVIAGLLKQDFGLPALAKQLEEALAELAAERAPVAYQTPYLTGSLAFDRPLVMGIVNVTPDSFYDGGRYDEPARAVEHIWRLKEAGADIIDIGGASSRPGHTPVGVEVELKRVLPVLEAVAPTLGLPISIDTDQAEVAEQALAAGAAIINDIGGLTPEMAALAARTGAPTVIMHQGGGDRISERLQDFFRERVAFACARGVEKRQLILDPGFGFGKEVGENLEIMRSLTDLQVLGLPLLIGLSNKRFIGAVLDAPLAARTIGNVAASVWALAHGAQIIRTHEVAELAQAARMVAALREGGAWHGATAGSD